MSAVERSPELDPLGRNDQPLDLWPVDRLVEHRLFGVVDVADEQRLDSKPYRGFRSRHDVEVAFRKEIHLHLTGSLEELEPELGDPEPTRHQPKPEERGGSNQRVVEELKVAGGAVARLVEGRVDRDLRIPREREPLVTEEDAGGRAPKALSLAFVGVETLGSLFDVVVGSLPYGLLDRRRLRPIGIGIGQRGPANRTQQAQGEAIRDGHDGAGVSRPDSYQLRLRSGHRLHEGAAPSRVSCFSGGRVLAERGRDGSASIRGAAGPFSVAP